MAESYYKLGRFDAHRLAAMIGQLSDSRNRVQRADMALYCWSRMVRSGKPCPYFALGIRTLMRECGATEREARGFLERAERLGWILRVGEIRSRSGRYERRTFLWVAEEAADEAGMGLDEWLESEGVRRSTVRPPNPETSDPVIKAQQKTSDGSDVSAGRNVTHQSTEYSESSALHSPLSVGECEALYGGGEEESYDLDVTPAWMRGGADA